MTAQTALPAREVAKIVSDILASEMELDEEHCLLGNQQWDIPADKKLFVVVFDQSAPPFGATSFIDTEAESSTYLKEVQQASVLHDIRIEIMSFDQQARTRKEEVIMALVSQRSQQDQERYQFQLGRAQAPVDASETENTKRLQKFVIHVNATALHQKVKEPPRADYFDKFNGATEAGTAKAPQITEEQ